MHMEQKLNVKSMTNQSESNPIIMDKPPFNLLGLFNLNKDIDDTSSFDTYPSSTKHYSQDPTDWNCVVLQTAKLDEYKYIKDSDIMASYVYALNEKRELLLYYQNGWNLTGGIIHDIVRKDNKTDYNQKLVLTIHEQTQVDIKIEGLIGVTVYTNIYSPRMTFAPSVVEKKYITYYLASVTDSSKSSGGFFRWSKLIDMDVYAKHSYMLNKLYAQYKIQLVLDLDHTLLESCKFTTETTYGTVASTDGVFANKHMPDGIARTGDHVRYIWLRPYAKEFLRLVSILTQLSYWTAGNIECQSVIMKCVKIDNYAANKFYLDSCSLTPENYPYKSFNDLNAKIKKDKKSPDFFGLDRTILIDDLKINCDNNKNNSYLINVWKVTGTTTSEELKDRLNDMKLLDLIPFIKKLSDQVIHENRDIRSLLLTMHNLAKLNNWIEYPINTFPATGEFSVMHTEPDKSLVQSDAQVDIKPESLGTVKIDLESVEKSNN